MAMTKKDRMQLIAIGAIALIALTVLVYSYRDSFLPKPDRGSAPTAARRQAVPVLIDDSFFSRQDFRELKTYGPSYAITVPDRTAEQPAARQPTAVMEAAR